MGIVVALVGTAGVWLGIINNLTVSRDRVGCCRHSGEQKDIGRWRSKSAGAGEVVVASLWSREGSGGRGKCEADTRVLLDSVEGRLGFVHKVIGVATNKCVAHHGDERENEAPEGED